LKKHKKFMDKKQTPYTPAVSLFYALRTALELMEKNGGIEKNIARHAAGAKYTREQLVSLGFELLAETGMSRTQSLHQERQVRRDKEEAHG